MKSLKEKLEEAIEIDPMSFLTRNAVDITDKTLAKEGRTFSEQIQDINWEMYLARNDKN